MKALRRSGVLSWQFVLWLFVVGIAPVWIVGAWIAPVASYSVSLTIIWYAGCCLYGVMVETIRQRLWYWVMQKGE